jgi:hypothetical protein
MLQGVLNMLVRDRLAEIFDADKGLLKMALDALEIYDREATNRSGQNCIAVMRPFMCKLRECCGSLFLLSNQNSVASKKTRQTLQLAVIRLAGTAFPRPNQR